MEEEYHKFVELPGFYKRAIEKNKLLTKEQEKKLFKKIANKSHYHKEDINKTMETLIYSNQKLVLKFAFKYVSVYPNIDLFDLISCGNIGLTKAIESFDLSRNVSFSAYAIPCIIRHMAHHIQWNSAIVVDKSQVNKKMKSMKFPKIFSLEKQLNVDNESIHWEDVLEDENSKNDFKRLIIKSTFDDLLKLVSEKDRKILKYVYEKDYNLARTCRVYHLCRESIRKKMQRIIKKLKLRANSTLEKIKS